MHHEQVKLKNDLQTLFIDFPGSTAASVQIWFRAGSALETGNDKGIAHFLEHMFFKGTKKRPGSAMAHEIESFGGELNAFTSFDYTCYYANSPNSQLDKTIEILMDMVSNPLFEQSELEPERDVVFEEYRRSQDNPGQYSFQKLQNACFTAGYSHPILGNEKTIKNFTREQLIKFRSAFYCNSNALLVVAGDLKKKPKLIKTIESFSLPKGNPTLFPKFKLKTKEATQIHQKDVRMAQVYMSIQAPAFSDKGAAAEDLAFNCLGHGESSYLYKSLVTDGSIANTSSSSTMFMAKGGVHFIRVVFPIDNQTKVFNILAKVVEELLTNGIDNKEVQKIKNQYLSTKVYEMESLESYAFSLGHGFAQAGDINSEEDFVNRIKATSNFAVNRAYKDIFNRPMHICLQLPNDASVPKIKKTISAFRSKLEKIKAKSNKLSQSKFSVKTSQFDPQVKWIKIKEGVTLIHRKNPLNPTFVLHAYVRGGLTDETKLTNGSHSLIASLVTQGYAGTNMEKLKALLDDRSANLHGFSGKNAYGLTMHGQSEHIPELVDHFSGSFLNPEMPSKMINHEKEMSLRSISNHEKDPIKQCFKAATKIFFNKHPYSMSLTGTSSSIKKITRKGLIDMHQKNISKREVLFTYCGDQDVDEVLQLLAPTFDKLKPRKDKKTLGKKVVPQNKALEYIPFDREQTQVFVGIPSAALGSKDNLYLKMLTTHLSGQSSDLFVEVRDRQGLCYAAQPVQFTALEGGYWGIYMACGHDKVKAALAAIRKILDQHKKSGLSRGEFNRIKKMIEGQSLINIQTNDDYASIYSITALQGKGLDYYHLNNQAVKNLSYEEFQKSIKKILGRNWSTVVVGRETEL